MFYHLHPTGRSLLRSQHKEGEPELVIISKCKTRWSSRHDLLTQYLRVAAMLNKLFRTQFQLRQPPQQQGNKCCCGADRRAGVSTLCGYDYLQGWHGPPSCRHSHPVPETQVVRERWSCGRNATWRVAVETWFHGWGSYLGSLLQALSWNSEISQWSTRPSAAIGGICPSHWCWPTISFYPGYHYRFR